METPLLFPLQRLGAVDVFALQAARSKLALLQPAFMQQRPRSLGNLLASRLPVNLPWNATRMLSVSVPRVVHRLLPYPPTYFRIVGTTKDANGVALGSCVVDWFRTSDDVKLDTVTSDANGLFEFRTAGQPPNAYYLVAYKAGSPDVAGTTVNTLVGT